MTSASADTQGHSKPPGPTLRQIVASQGRRQDWIAARLGVTEGWLSRVVSGVTAPGPVLAARFADLLGVPVDDVLAASRESQIAFHARRLSDLRVEGSCAVREVGDG